MCLPAFVLVAFLALGPRSVFSRFNSVSFSSVKQCGSFDISFTGGKPPASLPLTLTVVPFNSTPVSITIPSFSWNNITATGAAVTFLPFQADTQFVASVDDLYGFPTGDVSDIMRVDVSNDTSCLSASNTTPTPRYTIKDKSALAQCEPFELTFDPTVVDVPPIVRGFVPRGDSFIMNRTAATVGTATYTLSAPSSSSVVLMFSDDTGFKQSSELLPVSRNPTGDSSCLVEATMTNAATAAPVKQPGLSKSAVIAIGVVSGTVVGGIALTMALWLYFQRRKADRNSVSGLEAAQPDPDAFDGEPKYSQKVPSPAFPNTNPTVIVTTTAPLPSISQRLDDQVRYVQNPPYGDDQMVNISPRTSQYQPPSPDPSMQQPISSIPIPTQTPPPLLSTPEPRTVLDEITAAIQRENSKSDSLSSDDIEHILEMATIYNPGGERRRPSTERVDTVTLASTLQSTTGFSFYETEVPALPTPLPSNPTTPFTRKQTGGVNTYSLPQSVADPDTPAVPVAGPSRISTSSPTPRMLSPDSTSYRNPPQAPLPSSPLSEFMTPPNFPQRLPEDGTLSRDRSFEGRRSKAPRVLPLSHSRRPTNSTIDSIPEMVNLPRR